MIMDTDIGMFGGKLDLNRKHLCGMADNDSVTTNISTKINTYSHDALLSIQSCIYLCVHLVQEF